MRGAGWSIAAAVVAVVAWYVTLNLCRPYAIVDERIHTRHIGHLLTQTTAPDDLAMPKTFHHLMAWAGAPFRTWLGAAPGIHWACAATPRALWLWRGYCVVLALAMLVALRYAHAALDPRAADARTALTLAHPLLFPFYALCYTDVPALGLVMVGLGLHLRGRYAWAALPLLAAALVRQSHIFWLAWMMLLPTAAAMRGVSGPAWLERALGVTRRDALARWPYALALLIYLALLGYDRDTFAPLSSINRPRFNPAQFYMFGLLAAALYGPLWLPRLAGAWRAGTGIFSMRAGRVAFNIGLLAAIALLYRSTHAWNFGLGTYRHYVLHAFTEQPATISLAAAVLVLFGHGYLRWLSPRAHAIGLPTAWVGGLLFLGPHWLVEPRYYFVPLVLVDVFAQYDAAERRRLLIWFIPATIAILIPTAWFEDPSCGLW